MTRRDNWIWLPKGQYKDNQTTVYSGFLNQNGGNYTVAEFVRKYTFEKKILRAELRFSGDTAFQLFCNEQIVATGPACVGGDFIGNDTVRENFYAFETTIYPDTEQLDFFARVQMMPVHICEYSKGHGGFMLSGLLTFEDGMQGWISTDESWLVRYNKSYQVPKTFDGRIEPDGLVQAESVKDIWQAETAPIPIRQERELLAENGHFSLCPHEEKKLVLELNKIWAGFVHVVAKTQGQVALKLYCRERKEKVQPEELFFVGDQEYRGFYMHSAGEIEVIAKNESSFDARITISFLETHYPVCEEAITETSDEELNLVLETCKHTLKICRQTHHLDSPRHCEPMACTGDYYIESLMTPFAFGDMGLAEFDLLRTANMLERENGRMFHTTYSLIWVKMLWDVYLLTGNIELLRKCEKALGLLLRRFETYIGENGLIENPPDYMFVDWIYIDEISMHHPPKALGQSCLNMFYFGALGSAESIYRVIGAEETADDCQRKGETLRKAINAKLFDSTKGCYFEGLNTPTPENLIGTWMPPNVEKRYYLKHSNILAAYFGVCDEDTGRDLIRRIMSDEIGGDCQPYFLHYLLEAVYRLGLRETYTLPIINRWKAPVSDCPKGLVEGFVAPEPTYRFDHSHAWGGTPLYSLPKAMLGLEITKPGMEEIRLSPSLLGSDHAKVELLTPKGKVVCSMRKDRLPEISAPKEIAVILR